jgi:hypothetical protein
MKKIILLCACFCFIFSSISAQCTLKLAVDTVYHPSCPWDNDAAILLKISNGRAPFSYNWAYQDIPLLDRNRQTLPNIPSGKYSVTVTDASGCRDSILNIIVRKDTSFVTVTTTPTTNGLDGKATVTYTIGTDAYTQQFSNLRFGNNTVVIRHPRGCTTSLIVQITGPVTCALKIIDSIYQPSCYGQPTGRIIIKTSNAILPLTYHWTNYPTDIRTTIQSSFVLPSVNAGVYGVKVTDAMGCRDSLLNLIVKEDTPKITVTTTPATNGQNGMATVSVIIGKDTSFQRFTNLKVGDTSVIIIISNTTCPYGEILITITGTTAVNDFYTEGLEKFEIVQNSAHQAAVYIKFKEKKEVDLYVFTVLGQEIRRQSLVGQDMQVDLQDLPLGMLLFSLKMKDKMATKKVVLIN